MANMSYCRFENTYADFNDCVDALQNDEIQSESEKVYAERLYELAKTYVGLWEMNKQSEEFENEEELDIPTPENEREWFRKYLRVQASDQFNMIAEQEQAANAAGLSLETYQYIASNYSTFLHMFKEDYDEIMN